NAFESALGAGAIIEQQQDSGDDLNAKQEQRHAAEVVPDRMTMERNFLFVGQMRERANRQTLVKPVFCGFDFHDSISSTEDTEENRNLAADKRGFSLIGIKTAVVVHSVFIRVHPWFSPRLPLCPLWFNFSHARVTTTSSPRVLTLYSSNGRGGGPPMVF